MLEVPPKREEEPAYKYVGTQNIERNEKKYTIARQQRQEEEIEEYPQLQNAKARLSRVLPENLHHNPIIACKPVEPQKETALTTIQRPPQRKAQKVEEMLAARKKQKLEAPPANLPPQPRYYESIEDRIKRQSQSCSGTPKVAARNLTPQGNPSTGSRQDMVKITPQSTKGADKKMDIQRRIIDLMLESGPSSGTPSRQQRIAFGGSSKKATPKTAAHQTQKRPPALPPRQARPTSGALPREAMFSGTVGQTMTPRDRGLQSQLNVAIRNEIWLQQRNEKINKQLSEKEATKLQGCTFKPHFETKDHKYVYQSGLNECQSVYRGLSPTKLSSEEMNVIMHSNSYSQINEIKARSKSRDKSMSQGYGQSTEYLRDMPSGNYQQMNSYK